MGLLHLTSNAYNVVLYFMWAIIISIDMLLGTYYLSLNGDVYGLVIATISPKGFLAHLVYEYAVYLQSQMGVGERFVQSKNVWFVMFMFKCTYIVHDAKDNSIHPLYVDPYKNSPLYAAIITLVYLMHLKLQSGYSIYQYSITYDIIGKAILVYKLHEISIYLPILIIPYIIIRILK